MTIMIKMRCKNCEKVLRTSSDNSGKRIKCPKCQTIFVIPSPSEFSERKNFRAIIDGNNKSTAQNYITIRSDEKPFCQVLYTEADPMMFVLKRDHQCPLLDLSEGGLGFLIKSNDETQKIASGSIFPIEIDFPILIEPLSCRIEIRWITSIHENKLFHIGAKFLNTEDLFNKTINNCIHFITLRPDVWSIEE